MYHHIEPFVADGAVAESEAIRHIHPHLGTADADAVAHKLNLRRGGYHRASIRHAEFHIFLRLARIEGACRYAYTVCRHNQ